MGGIVKTIWKYPIGTETEIEMPEFAQVLSVQVQNGEPFIWVLVNPDLARTMRRFVTYGTGHQLPSNPGMYLGTFQLSQLGLVFHLFEVLV